MAFHLLRASGFPIISSLSEIYPDPKKMAFWRNSSKVFAGSILASLVPFLALPIFSRLIGPSELGSYFIVVAFASIVATFSCFSLDLAIFQSRSPQRLARLCAVAFWTSLLTFIIGLAAMALAATLYGGLKTPAVKLGLGFLLGALLSYNQVLLSCLVYGGLFADYARKRVYTAVCVVLFQLLLISVGLGFNGMVVGHILGAALIAIALSLRFGVPVAMTFTTIKRLAQVYWRFPLLTMPANLVNRVSASMPVLLLGLRFAPDYAGQFGMTDRSTSTPVSIVAGSVLTVFKQEASEEYRKTGQCAGAFSRTSLRLFLLSCLPFLAAWFLVEDGFVFIFGEPWREAGFYAKALLPMLFLKFNVSPLSYTLILCGKQGQDLIWQLALLVVTLFALLVTSSPRYAVVAYSFSYAAMYCVYYYLSFRAARAR